MPGQSRIKNTHTRLVTVEVWVGEVGIKSACPFVSPGTPPDDDHFQLGHRGLPSGKEVWTPSETYDAIHIQQTKVWFLQTMNHPAITNPQDERDPKDFTCIERNLILIMLNVICNEKSNML